MKLNREAFLRRLQMIPAGSLGKKYESRYYSGFSCIYNGFREIVTYGISG